MTENNKVSSALNKVAPNGKCAFCGSQSLTLLSTDSSEAQAYSLFMWADLGKGIPTYIVGCNICGHIHQFAQKHLDGLVDKNGG